jgi:hypothetical protein
VKSLIKIDFPPEAVHDVDTGMQRRVPRRLEVWTVREVTLQDRDGLRLSVSRRPEDGALVLRREVRRLGPWGAEHVDYALVVAPADVPRVMAALGAPAEGVDPLDVLLAHRGDLLAVGEREWLRSIGVSAEESRLEAPAEV